MPSIREYMHDSLTSRMLWPQEADAILAEYFSQEQFKSVRINDPHDSYGKPFLALLMMGLDPAADAWLAKNAPNHFARPMFNEAMMAEAKKTLGMT
jgi:hypothetical protein